MDAHSLSAKQELWDERARKLPGVWTLMDGVELRFWKAPEGWRTGTWFYIISVLKAPSGGHVKFCRLALEVQRGEVGVVKLADSVILPNSEGPVLCIVIPFRFVLPL